MSPRGGVDELIGGAERMALPAVARGRVAKVDPITVVLENYSTGIDYEVPDTQWSGVLPTPGDECVVLFDDDGDVWAVARQSFEPGRRIELSEALPLSTGSQGYVHPAGSRAFEVTDKAILLGPNLLYDDEGNPNQSGINDGVIDLETLRAGFRSLVLRENNDPVDFFTDRVGTPTTTTDAGGDQDTPTIDVGAAGTGFADEGGHIRFNAGSASDNYMLYATRNGTLDRFEGCHPPTVQVDGAHAAGTTTLQVTGDELVHVKEENGTVEIDGNTHTYTFRSMDGTALNNLTPAVPVGGYAAGLAVKQLFSWSAGQSIEQPNYPYGKGVGIKKGIGLGSHSWRGARTETGDTPGVDEWSKISGRVYGINGEAAEDFLPGANGGHMWLSTCPRGAANMIMRLFLHSEGWAGLVSADLTDLDLDDPAAALDLGDFYAGKRLLAREGLVIRSNPIAPSAADIEIQGTKPTITGSRGGNAAMADFLSKFETMGMLIDATTA